MEWLLILGLGIWVYRQGQAIRTLERRLNAANHADRRTPSAPEVPDQFSWPFDTPPATEPVAAQPPPEPVAESFEPIIPVSRPKPARVEQPEPVFTPRPEPRPSPPAVEPVAAPALPLPTMTRESISTWLSENGLAWIGGGGLALGGLLLVGYAAQRGFFTPGLRIGLAVILGALMVAASEWILRQKPSITGGRHLLAAAVSAGAGAVTLYGAICAAYGLYQMIQLGLAAVLAGAISLGLLALSLRHGQALALVALVGAVLTPAFTGISDWSTPALTAYAMLIGATGFSISALRLWGKAGTVTALGLVLLSGAPLADRHTLSAVIIMALAAVGPFAATLWRRRFRLDDAADPSGRDFRSLPATALVLTTLASFFPWFIGQNHGAHLPSAVALSGLLVVLGALMATRDMIRPTLFAAPVGVAIACQLLVMAVGARQPTFPSWQPWLYALTGLIPAVALWAALRLPAVDRTRILAIGGVGVAVLASLTWPILHAANRQFSWAPAAALAAALFALSPLIARRVEASITDRGLALWLAAAAELAFLAIHAAGDPRFEPVAFALAALALAVAAWRLPWRGLATASVVGGLIAFIAMLRPDFVGATLEGRLSLPFMLAVSATAAGLLVGAALLIWNGGGEAVRNEAEAQRASALLIILLAVFVALHVIFGGAREAVDGLLESSLRTLVLLSTGLLLVLRQRPEDGPISRWRTVIVVSAGLAHGLLLQGLVWNPWWGMGQPPAGPPVLNTLILSYLAPAGLVAAIAWRRKPEDDRWTQVWIIAAPVFAFLWALLAVRHLFHGADMGHAPAGRLEWATGALLPMLTARALVEPRLGMASAQARLLRAGAPAVGWAALGILALVFGLVVSPWWGPFDEPLAPIWSGVLLFGLQAVAIALAWGVSRKDATVGRAALVVAVILALSLAAHLIRWAFHGATISVGAVGRAESAAYAILALAVARELLSPRLAERASTDWLVRAAPACGWLALVGAGLVFGLRASPWWGPSIQPLASTGAAVLLFVLYGLGAIAMVRLRRGDTPYDRAALAAAVGTLFALLTLLIRYAFRGLDMHAPTLGGGLETWTFSALWAVFGLAVLGLGAARKDIVLRWAGLAALLFTAGKVMLFDLARLEGVTRAASFLAVGALFLGGALLARRLNARHKSASEAETEADT